MSVRFTWERNVLCILGKSEGGRFHARIDRTWEHRPRFDVAVCGDDGERCNDLRHNRSGFRGRLMSADGSGVRVCAVVTFTESIPALKRALVRVATFLARRDDLARIARHAEGDTADAVIAELERMLAA